MIEEPLVVAAALRDLGQHVVDRTVLAPAAVERRGDALQQPRAGIVREQAIGQLHAIGLDASQRREQEDVAEAHSGSFAATDE